MFLILVLLISSPLLIIFDGFFYQHFLYSLFSLLQAYLLPITSYKTWSGMWEFRFYSDFRLVCSSQNPIFRLLMHWKAHLFRHFRLFQTFSHRCSHTLAWEKDTIYMFHRLYIQQSFILFFANELWNSSSITWKASIVSVCVENCKQKQEVVKVVNAV